MQEMSVTLKNQEKITLRPISMKDVNERHEFFVNLSIAQTGMVHTVDEIDIHTHETHDKIHDFLKNRRGLWLLAINKKGKVVGEVDIFVKHLARIRHNGLLTIGVLPAYQSQGLGTILMDHALLWAKEHGLLRIELAVFASNARARDLYKKFGFVVEGTRKDFLCHGDKSFEDDLLMAKYLQKL